MAKIDPRRTIGLVAAMAAVVLGYVYFFGDNTASVKGKGVAPLPAISAAALPAASRAPTEQKGSQPGSTGQPAAEQNRSAEAAKEFATAPGEWTSVRSALPDPFRGASAELVKLRKEAELLDASIRILDLKAKQDEAELRRKRARALGAMIEKDPRILLNLPHEPREGELIIPVPGRGGSARGFPPKEEIQEIVKSRTPSVRMILLVGGQKRVTIEYQGYTVSLAAGDKFQDLEVLNITPRGALFRIAGKQDFIPVAEKEEERPSARPSPNPGRPS